MVEAGLREEAGEVFLCADVLCAPEFGAGEHGYVNKLSDAGGESFVEELAVAFEVDVAERGGAAGVDMNAGSGGGDDGVDAGAAAAEGRGVGEVGADNLVSEAEKFGPLRFGADECANEKV